MKLVPIFFVLTALASPPIVQAQPVGSGPGADQPAAASANDVGVAAAATFRDPNAPLGSPANAIPQSSPTPVAEAASLKPDDSTVISNGPVPDTRTNRARYGAPLSLSGRQTRPAGN